MDRIEKLNRLDMYGVLGSVRQYLGAEEDEDQSRDHLIEELSPFQILDCYLKYEGIIGYTDKILKAVQASASFYSDELADELTQAFKDRTPIGY